MRFVSTRRDVTLLCVVEAYEVSAIERTGQFRGLFHVLGGRLSPLDGIGPDELNVESLLRRINDSRVAFMRLSSRRTPVWRGSHLCVLRARDSAVGTK